MSPFVLKILFANIFIPLRDCMSLFRHFRVTCLDLSPQGLDLMNIFPSFPFTKLLDLLKGPLDAQVGTSEAVMLPSESHIQGRILSNASIFGITST